MNKYLIILLVTILFFLQYILWFGSDGFTKSQQLENDIAAEAKQNLQLKATNLSLMAEVTELKKGQQAVVERARSELGMIHKGEVFYQITK